MTHVRSHSANRSRRPATPRSWEVRPYQPGDEEAVLALHARAYAGHPRRTLAHWRWRYVENPFRCTEVALALDADGRCLAVASGIGIRWMLSGDECRARLSGDTAVDPGLRTGLAGGRIVRAVMEALHDEYACRIDWGYPEPAIQRLGIRFMKWRILRDVTFLVRQVGGGPVVPAIAELGLREVSRFGPDVDELWRRCADQIGTGTIRDAAYLNWRYADHPDVGYSLLEAREEATQRLRGIAVIRAGGWSEEAMSLSDWLVPAGDDDAEAALIGRYLEEAERRGLAWACCWFAGDMAEAHHFQQRYGFFAKETQYQVCYRLGEPGPTRRFLHANWRQTLGDIDFF